MRHLIQPEDLSNQEFMDLIETASHILAHPELYKERAKGKYLQAYSLSPPHEQSLVSTRRCFA